MNLIWLLDHYRPPAGEWADWQRVETVLSGRNFIDVRRALLDVDYPAFRKDELLSALIRVGQHECVDAKTAVVACLLPGLRRIVGRYQDLLGPHDAWGELVAALWQQLASYDPERRLTESLRTSFGTLLAASFGGCVRSASGATKSIPRGQLTRGRPGTIRVSWT